MCFRTCGFDTLRSSEFRRTVESRAARKAASLGLDNILAPQPTYYSNRLQRASKDEPTGPGTGRETQEAVYNYDPATDVPDEFQPYYKGIPSLHVDGIYIQTGAFGIYGFSAADCCGRGCMVTFREKELSGFSGTDEERYGIV